jgi:hypothetical protein
MIFSFGGLFYFRVLGELSTSSLVSLILRSLGFPVIATRGVKPGHPATGRILPGQPAWGAVPESSAGNPTQYGRFPEPAITYSDLLTPTLSFCHALPLGLQGSAGGLEKDERVISRGR